MARGPLVYQDGPLTRDTSTERFSAWHQRPAHNETGKLFLVSRPCECDAAFYIGGNGRMFSRISVYCSC